jgi:hypothetical protein
MSISFRNDLGVSGIRAVPGAGVGPRAGEGRTVDSLLFSSPAIQPHLVPPAADPRPLDARSPDDRSLDARLADIKNSAAPRDLPDVKMDQIRELLFGEVQRQSEMRIITLETKVRELEAALQHRMDAMQARIDALAAETRDDRRSTLDGLARGIADLGDTIKRIPRD